jgi:hypothetical protein
MQQRSTLSTPSYIINFNQKESAGKKTTDFKLISDDSGTKTVDVSLQLDSSTDDEEFESSLKKLKLKKILKKKPLIIVIEKKRIKENYPACGEKRAAEGDILEEMQLQRKRVKVENEKIA